MTQKLPLEGIKVADFSWFGVGPITAKLLGAFGAEVVRVESESRPDGLRSLSPFALEKTGYNVSGWFNNYNAGKLSFSLNLNLPKGREIAYRLVRWADIFVNNFTPRMVESWGLTYDDLVKVKPDIIAAYTPMQGLDGPRRDYLGFGAVVGPVAGYNHLTGFPHREPVGLGTNYPDYIVNPGHTLVAVLAALRYRRKTGRGQRIELAQIESSVSALGPALLDYTVNGRVQTRAGNRVPNAAPHGAFPCLPVALPMWLELGLNALEMPGSDRWCAIAVFNDEQWRGLCEAMGNPAWCRDEKFATLPGRKRHEDELEQRVGEWTKEKSAHEVMELLQAHGVPAGAVQTAQDVLENDEHMRERGYYVYLEHPEAGLTAYDGPGFRLTRTPGCLRSPAPCLGEHTYQVCKEILDMDDEEIADLVAEQVLF
jgi:crotonobetainyl-CoA:carnitine CoA-transferase CaiB-like acyl-CoA transferase